MRHSPPPRPSFPLTRFVFSLGQDLSDGGHRAVRERIAGRDEEVVERQRRAAVFQPLERVSVERLGEVFPRQAGRDRRPAVPTDDPGYSSHASEDHRHRRDQFHLQRSELPRLRRRRTTLGTKEMDSLLRRCHGDHLHRGTQ